MSSSKATLQRLNGLLFGLTVLFVVVWQAPSFYTVQGLASYLPLHMFAETFSIVVSMLVFGVAWNVYSTERPGNIVILACALLAVGLIDFAHTLSFKGMPDFITPSGPEKAINLWLSARLIAALALLAVATRSWQHSYSSRARRGLLAVSLAVSAAVIWLGLAYPQAWPRTFIAGQGLTPFKIGAEYAIVAILLIPAVLFYRQARRPQSYDAAGLFAATVITILSELSFTVYSDVADIFNLLGHLYKIVAYMFIYRAVFVSGVREPFQRLDAELGENQRIANELRTASLYTRSLIEASLDPLVTISAEGKITDVNKATEDATGRSRSELIGTDFSDCFAEPEKAREGYRQAFLQGHISGHPLVLRHRDGHLTSMLYNASVYQNEKGEVLGVFASARDITERKKTEAALFEAQQIFRVLVENSPDIITRYDRDCRRTYVNPTYLKVAQIPPRELLGSTPAQRSPLPVPSADVLQKLLRRVLDSGVAEAVDVVWPMADNVHHWYNISAFPEFDREGKVVSVMTVSRDITERKLDEEALRRMNRELSAISNCSQILMRAEDEQALLDKICRVVCDDAGYRMAWVGYPENDEAKTIRPVAWAGVEDGYLAQAGINWADTERGRGPSGNAIRIGKSACCQDFSTDPNAAPWRESAMQRGYRSSISMPLKDESANTFGILTIYSTEPNAFTPDEIRLLEELAADLAFGIMVLRTRIERRQAEAALRENEEKYRALIEKIQVAVIVHGADTQILVSNSMAQEILGLTEDQLLGKMAIDPAWRFFREDGMAAQFDEYPVNKVLASRKALRNYVLGVHRPTHAHDVWALVNADPVFGNDDELTQIIVTFIDITERVQAEQALRAERGLFVAGPSVVFKWRAQEGWPVEYVSPNVANQFGYAPEDITSGKVQYSAIVHPDDIGRVAAEVAAYGDQGVASFEQRYRIAGADGCYRWIEDFTTVVRGLDGSITHYLGYLQDITERKRVESELAQREHEYRTLADNSPDVIVRYDRQGRRIYVNPEFERVNHLTAQQVLGKTPAELSTELKPKSGLFTERLMAVMESGIADKIDLSWDKDGRQICWFVRAVPEFDAAGKVTSALTIWSDITERKLAEETLRREQALLNRIMVTSPVGIAVVSREGLVTFANPQAERILGLSKEEITQRSYNATEWHTTAIDGGPFPDEAQPFSRVMATRQPVFDVQHAIVWPDGHRVLLSINGAPIFDALGEIEGVAFAIEDITERKHAEDELRRSEFGLTEAQRIAHLGSWHMDLATNEVYWSEELYKLYGFDPALPPPLYTESMKLFTPESWERLSSAIAHAVETGTSYELELELVNKDGRKGWMSARGELVRDERGTPVMVRGVVMDITARKQAEEEIRKLNQELEQRVAERTAQLEAANKELESFSYSVSHDLRTPLRAIDGFSHILLEEYAGKLDDEGRRLLNVVRDNTSRMGQLIDDILRFSRAGRLEINYSDIDMEQLAYSVSVELRPVIAGDKLQLEIGHLPPTSGDSAMMRQVFVNLLSNAIKFSHNKEPAIIEIGGFVEGNEAIYFVKDNGAGFDMQYVNKLFGVFQRLHGVNEFEGTGIGLAIVKRIITRHGGRVWAEGKVNEGAVFYFALPQLRGIGDEGGRNGS